MTKKELSEKAKKKFWHKLGDFGPDGLSPFKECLYEDALNALERELASEGNFDTGWHGFTSALEGLRITAKGDNLKVCVYSYCDELDDLITLDSDNGFRLSHKQFCEVAARCANVHTEIKHRELLSRSCTINDIFETAYTLLGKCDAELNREYAKVNEEVNRVLGILQTQVINRQLFTHIC